MSCGLKNTFSTHCRENQNTNFVTFPKRCATYKIIITRNVAYPWRQKKWGTVLNTIWHYINGICLADSTVDIHTIISTMRCTKIEKLHKKLFVVICLVSLYIAGLLNEKMVFLFPLMNYN
jgi:hypothetical protein